VARTIVGAKKIIVCVIFVIAIVGIASSNVLDSSLRYMKIKIARGSDTYKIYFAHFLSYLGLFEMTPKKIM
jgi:hypothetical protein